MPLDYILESKLTLYGHPYYLNDQTIDNWSFWKFLLNIDKINKRFKSSEDISNTINGNTTYRLLKNMNKK